MGGVCLADLLLTGTLSSSSYDLSFHAHQVGWPDPFAVCQKAVPDQECAGRQEGEAGAQGQAGRGVLEGSQP